MISEISDIKRFPNSKHISSYLRTAPGIDASNDASKTLKVNKMSRKLALELLLQSYVNFKKGNPRLKSWLEKHTGIKSRGKMRIAIMRRVLCEVYQMLKTNSYHFHRDKANHLKRMTQYQHFLEKNLKTA